MNPPFVDHCMELLAPLGAVRVRRMFGGWGLYVDELFIAIVAAERLYLKADAAARDVFAAAGCEPFVYSARTAAVAMGYWSAPADALDSPALMQPWARLALAAAVKARAAKRCSRSAPAPATRRRAPAPPAGGPSAPPAKRRR